MASRWQAVWYASFFADPSVGSFVRNQSPHWLTLNCLSSLSSLQSSLQSSLAQNLSESVAFLSMLESHVMGGLTD
jgi:hypothetical protein